MDAGSLVKIRIRMQDKLEDAPDRRRVCDVGQGFFIWSKNNGKTGDKTENNS